MLKTQLKILRAQKGLNQKEIANLLKITERQYQRYEAGQIDIPVSKIIFLADYFNVSTDYLLGRTDQP